MDKHHHSASGVAASPGDPTPEELCVVLARELRRPLATIEGYLDLLANDGVGPITEEQRNFLGVVARNVQRISSVVADWYEMARIEAGHLELELRPVDLTDVVDRAVAELRASVRAKEQQLTVELPADPPTVLGDERALLRVVSNLLSNAHKYTPPGGAIWVVVERAARQVRLSVTDTGIGIRDEDRPRLFRKFFRAHLTDAAPGTGLGLALTRALLERMGGEISFASVLGSGSTFTVLLRGAADGPAPPGPEGAPHDAGVRAHRAAPASAAPGAGAPLAS